MAELEFPVLPMCHLHRSDFPQEGTSEQGQGNAGWQTVLEGWMGAHDLTMDSDTFVVKPAEESNGKAVMLVNSLHSVAQHAQHIFAQVRLSMHISSSLNQDIAAHFVFTEPRYACSI